MFVGHKANTWRVGNINFSSSDEEVRHHHQRIHHHGGRHVPQCGFFCITLGIQALRTGPDQYKVSILVVEGVDL